MNTLKRFGSGSKLYTFPANSQVNYSDNFASLITKTSRMAGVNGGLSALGTGRGLSPIGTVRADIWLKFNDYVEATDNVASLRQMADWGLMPLWRQPLYGAEQFCWARLTDLPRQEDVKNVPHKQIKIPVTFEWAFDIKIFSFGLKPLSYEHKLKMKRFTLRVRNKISNDHFKEYKV
jgi:hypothetical protein